MLKLLTKSFLPKSMLGRSLMIIVTPLVLLQVIAGYIFYESHWRKVSLTLSRSVAGDVATIIELMRLEKGTKSLNQTFQVPARHMGLTVSYIEGEILSVKQQEASGKMEETLAKALREAIGRPFAINSTKIDRHVTIDVQLPDGVINVVTSRKRLFSTTTYIFLLWMVGSSLVLFAVATIFMRNQVKPIRRLAEAADDFGKGRDASKFKPEGATEVRQAAIAFIAMRERIQRHITQRTEMLAGVSHDLRTPLTRMKLQLEMATETSGLTNLREDLSEMEIMLGGYLDFAKGEEGEKQVLTDLGDMLNIVVHQARRKGGDIDLHVEGEVNVPVRPKVFKRCLINLIDNAVRYAENVSVRVGKREAFVDIVIDDDGPGIPEEHREDVFKPFFRMEESRNLKTGGVGLGLSISRDIVRGHGGDIKLDISPMGGLRARVGLPF